MVLKRMSVAAKIEKHSTFISTKQEDEKLEEKRQSMLTT